MPKQKLYLEQTIYKAKRGRIYDDQQKQFNCYRPAFAFTSPPTYIADCWVCDSAGKLHPGYNVSPVPVLVQNLGQIVGAP
jgi:hypothetical protein